MATNSSAQRLDLRLVEQGLARSRSQARDAIRRGTVRVDGVRAVKAGQLVTSQKVVSRSGDGQDFVSRAALKLIAALDEAGLDVAGKDCLDIGASTGGFTEVLLARGAARIIAVDVGHGQMDEAVRNDPRVMLHERLNARDLTAAHLDGTRPQLIVADVSFISLKLALPPALELSASGADLAALIKPQFEAGPDHVAKDGVVRNPLIHKQVCADISHWLETACGWSVGGIVPSPVTGAAGNQEFLIWAHRPEAA